MIGYHCDLAEQLDILRELLKQSPVIEQVLQESQIDIVCLFWALACQTADKQDAMNDADFAAQRFHFTDE